MTTEEFRKRGRTAVLLTYFRRHWKLFALDMICALLVSVIDLVFPLLVRRSLNELLPAGLYRTFFALMAVSVAAFALRSLLQYTITYWGHTFGIRVEADIRHDLFVHMEELDVSFYDHNRTGELMGRLTTDLFEITELAHHGPEDIVISVLTILGALGVMFSIEWRLALLMLAILPVFMLVVFSRRRKLSAAAKKEKQKVAAIHAGIESSLSGMRTTRAFANEPAEEEKFNHANEEFKVSKTDFHKEMGLFNASLEFFAKILPVAVISFGGWCIMRGTMNAVDLLTFNLYISTLIAPVRKLAAFTETFARGFAGLDRFMTLMRMEPELKDAPDAAELKTARGEIDVDHVTFSYEPVGTPVVLHDVSLHVSPGETVAVVGPSGGGKSTLCQLIPRFYDVNDGAVRVDGLDVRRLKQASLRRSIGIVQQDVFLFADTVRENIRYGRPDATEEEIIEAAKRAEIYDDILAMPDGLDTYVGERGTLLSGGQKQRVSIARIFLKDPPILILDEATSALDSLTEARIQHAFDELSRGRTTLIIAHRLSTIRKAGRILVMEAGRITEQGSHEELLAKDGAYAALWRTQNARTDE